MPIEHLYETSDEERATLDGLVKVLADPTSEEGGDAAAASAALVEFAAGSPGRDKAQPASSRPSSSASPAPPSSRRSSGSPGASRP